MKCTFCLIVAAFWTSTLWSQDPIFSQFYAMPLQINPAFAGSAHAPRIGGAYRHQWTGFNAAYRTYAAFYEQQFQRLNSGIGFHFEGDNAGNGIYQTTRFSAIYAYRLQINDQLGIKLGAEGGMYQTNLDWNKLVFPDQIDATYGISLPTDETRPDATSRTRLDVSAGLLLLSEKFYLGVGLKHLNTPKESILLINDNITRGLPIRYAVHGGTEWVFNKGNKHQPPSFISPNFLILSQGPYRQINIGAYASVGSIFAGLWHRNTLRNSDSMILLAGFREGIYKFGVSYDLTISGLSNQAGATFELTFGLLFDKKPGKRKIDINDCTRMFQ
ncbi:MAG: type IX secretion system membrane protein PorP/SprF [Saprospiraceae bacterium]|nr:type IX secretion system membrane protein PorP/SprF [Saprospiraceae bacterium]